MNYSNDEILEAIRGNDVNRHNQALKQLYLDHVVNGKVKDLIQFYGSQKLDADEIIQEGIILLDDLIRSGKFQSKSKVRTFLIGICKNLIRADGKKIDRITYATEPLNMPDYDDNEQSPEDLIILEEKSDSANKRDQLLQQLLNQLTDKCKQVLYLYYFLAQSMAQVAEAQGLKNANQAKKAAGRCRKQLEQKIQKQPQLANFLKQSL